VKILSVVLSVRVPESLDKELTELSKKLKKTKGEILKEAIVLGLEKLLEKIKRIELIDRIVNEMIKKNVKILLEKEESIVDIVSSERK